MGKGKIAWLLGIVLAMAVTAVQAQDVTIVHMGWVSRGEAGRIAIEQKAREFEALNPGVKIDIQVPPGNYNNNFAVRLAGGVAPDITEFNEGDGGLFVMDGVFLDLRPYFERDPDLVADLFPSGMKASTWLDGSIWSIPSDIYPMITLYNADLFALKGLAPPSPENWTWETYFDAARKLTADADGDGQNETWGVGDLARMWEVEIWVRQAGGSVVDRRQDPRQVSFNSPEVLEALEFAIQLHQFGVAAASPNEFARGVVGMVSSFAPAYLGVRNDIEFEWGVAPPTHGPKTAGSAVPVNGFQIGANTAHPDVAWEWLRFLTSEQGQLDYAEMTKFVPSRRSALQQYPAVTGLSPEALQPLSFAALNPDGYHYTMGAPIDLRRQPMVEIFNRAVLGNESPTSVLDSVQSTVSALLREALGSN